MTSAMVQRITRRYDLPLAEGIELLQPESTVLNFGVSQSIDIGQLCYMQRVIPTVATRGGTRRVVIESLCRARVEHVRRLISHISFVAEHHGLRQQTLHSRFTRLIVFVNWADVHGWPDVLASELTARPAFRAYAAFVRDRVARNDMGLNAGATQQLRVAQALGDFLELEDFSRGFNLLRKDHKTSEATVPPCEISQGKVLAICESLFNGLCTLVLEKKFFPYALAMPKYLNFPNDRLWIFPCVSWFKTPAMLTKAKTSAGYHFADGRLSTAEELKAEYPAGKTSNRWQTVQQNARQYVVDANTDFNHYRRWHLAAQARNAYVILFLAATGMNWAQTTNLPWPDEEFDVEATKQGFRTIKWRASGKQVSFELPVASLPAFKRFLDLRQFLLQGRSCDHLFFRSATAALPPQPFRTNVDATYQLLRRLDPTLEKILPREWRAAKSDWLLRNTDPATAALVLQSSVKTVLRSYAEGSETLHHEEMGSLLKKIASTVIARGQVLEGGTPRAVGQCASIGAPAPVATATIPIVPDCRGAEGCLFCDKLKVHVDESDVRKLLSCRYCITLAAPAHGSFESFQKVLQPILDRINQILKEVADHDPELVRRVTAEVEENGELTPYWAAKADMLMTLGV